MTIRGLTVALATWLLVATGCDGSPSAPGAGAEAKAGAEPTAGAPEAGGTAEAPANPGTSAGTGETGSGGAAAPPADDEKKTTRPGPPPMTDDSGNWLYGRVLALVVTEKGLVRYDKFEDHELREALERAVTWYDRTPMPTDRDEKLAFLCNAYNANVLARAYRESVKPGFESVVKVPGFFDSHPIRVGREGLTLNDLENKLIRPMGDARIHAALVCGAMSCPPLRGEPYEAAHLDAQLDDQCKRWVNDPTKFRMVDGKLGLSEILNWYGDDFRKPPFGSPLGFVLAYADPASDIARFIANLDEPPTQWIAYDWTLNKAE